MVETKILDLINSRGIFPQKWGNRDDVDQEAIDGVQDWVLRRASARDITEHNSFAYSNSVREYDSKASNILVVPELPQFMRMMPDDGLVLDLGAGHLRDSAYMADPMVRDALNREGMISPDVSKRLRVVPLEKSLSFLDGCFGKLEDSLNYIPLVVAGDFMEPGKGTPYFLGRDGKELAQVFTEDKGLDPVLDGIWACASYMVHMAPGKLEKVTRGWAETLKEGGVFAVSYINKRGGRGDIKLLASRSAPGEIKIFSHFDSSEVDSAFERAGMRLINSSTVDYDGHGHVMSDFFGNAFYRKE